MKTVFKFILIIAILIIAAMAIPYIAELFEAMGAAIVKIVFFIAIIVLFVYCVEE